MEVDGLDIQLALAFGPVKEEPVEDDEESSPDEPSAAKQDPKKRVRVLTRRVAWLLHEAYLSKFESTWSVVLIFGWSSIHVKS